jgi:hypothetical protein
LESEVGAHGDKVKHQCRTNNKWTLLPLPIEPTPNGSRTSALDKGASACVIEFGLLLNRGGNGLARAIALKSKVTGSFETQFY